MVRVAGLKSQLESGALESGPDGMAPARNSLPSANVSPISYKTGRIAFASKFCPD